MGTGPAMPEQDRPVEIDRLVPPRLRETLEERYLHPIEQAMKLEVLAHDPTFLADPVNHPALFADHGVIHVRDVAASLLSIAATANGVLLARRPPERQAFVAAYGLLATYLHDVGMHDQTRAGRRLHPIYAAHLVFGSDFDEVVEDLLAFDGPISRRLHDVQAAAPLAVPLDLVLRELLSLTLAHSKSTVPAPLLDNRVAFRRLAQQAVLTDLETHRATDGLPDPRDSQPLALTANTRRYASAADQSYAWLVSGEREQRSLADDVVDALRVLRVADALRQRGTSLRTTGGYEIFIDAATGQAVFSLRSTDNSKVYLLRGDSPKSAGEANLRAAAVTADGHLRIAFHRGAYLEPAAERSAAESTAHIVADILADVLPTFAAERLPDDLEPPSLRADKVQIQLERPGDNPEFAEDVASLVAAAHPELAHRVVTVADLEGVSPEERNRFYRGVPVAPRSGEARRILQQLARHGARIDGIDVDAAFADVRRVRIAAGEVLASIGSSSVFVYVATGPGLKVQPAGGYPPASIDPWIPVGTTGVIRRAERNGEVTAERDVEILMIPGDCYVRVWFRPYGAGQLADALAHALDATNGG